MIRYGLTPAYGLTQTINLSGAENFYDSYFDIFRPQIKTFTLTGLTPGKTYYFSVEVTTAGGTVNTPSTAFATPSPVLEVESSGVNLPHDATLAFGATTTGNIVSKSIILRNTGNGKLWVDGLISSPGYGVSGLGLAVLAAEGGIAELSSMGFSLRLLATAAGNYNGTFIIRSDDPFHADYTINVSGRVDPAAQSIAWSPTPTYSRLCPMPLDGIGGGSGIPVSYVVISGPGLIVDGVLTATGNGVVVVRALQAGNADYLPAPNIERTITFRDPDYRLWLNAVGGTSLTSGNLPLDFGRTALGIPVFRTLALSNNDACGLNITSISLPTGYDLPGFTAPLVIQPYGRDSIRVRLSALASGDQQGLLTIQSSSGPKTIPLTGSVCPAMNLAVPDPSFDGDGIVLTPGVAGSTSNDSIRAVVVQPDGKILAAGYTRRTNDDFIVARFLPDGSPDISFGTGGRAFLDPGATDQAHAMALDSAGRIVLAGISGGNFAIARLLPDGAEDSSFGSGGIVIIPVNAGSDGANAVAIDSAGSIIASGYASAGTTRNFAMVKLLADGSPETTFGSAGTGALILDLAAGANDEASAILVMENDNLLAGGTQTVFGLGRMILVKLDSNGALDTAFGSGGSAATPSSTSSLTLNAMTLLSDGGILTAGSAFLGGNTSQALLRWTTSGSFDSGFAPRLIPRSTADIAYALYADSAGYYTAGSSVRSSGITDFFLTHVLPDGTRDKSLGSNGTIHVPVGSGSSTAYAISLDQSCRPILGGSARGAGGDSDIALVRLGEAMSPLESWRLIHFGSTASSGEGADTNDAEDDGLANLAEYGLGLHPLESDSGQQPLWQRQPDSSFLIAFPVRPAVTSIAERSTSMTEGTWIPIPNTGDPGTYVFNVVPDATRMFFRLRFTNP